MTASQVAAGRPLQVVLFDLDGTISDSAPGILAALRHAFAEKGLPQLDPEAEKALLGPPFYESLPPLIGGVDRLPAIIASYRAHYSAGGMYDAVAYDGIVEVVAGAYASGIRLAVATSKPEPYAVPIVEYLGLAEYFETVGGDELDGSLPTKALVIDKVLGRLDRPDPARILMVGDRSHDVIGAREHGIACIGAGWGYSVPGELADAQAALICAEPRELGMVLGLEELRV
ncbi:MAG: HAD hydrolase-like protein [Jatrophihabitans sp.]